MPNSSGPRRIPPASLGRLDFGLFALVYSMTGFPLVLALAVLRGWRLRAAEPN